MVALGPRVGGAHVDVNLKMNSRSIDLVGGQIHRQLARIGDRNRQVYQQIGRDTVIAWRAALGAITTSAPLIGSAVSGVAGAATMLAGALYSTVQSSAAMLTLFGSVAVAAGTAKIGFEGFGDAIRAANPEDLAKALEDLTPAARDSALAVRSLSGAWQRVRDTVQENMFAGLSGEISKLGTTLLPVLEVGLGKMADSLNRLFDAVLKYVNSASGLEQINGVLEGSVSIFDRLKDAAVPFLDGVLRLFNALTPAGERLASRITDIAKRFQSWTQGAGFAERIDSSMQKAEKTAGLLFKVLGNLGSAIANVFNAGNTETNNFLQMLVDVTAKFKEWSASAEGQNSIVTWLQGSIEVMRAFGRAISSVFKVVTELADPRVIVSFLDTLTNAFDHLNRLPLAGIVSAFATLAEVLQPISGILLAIIIAGVSFNVLLGTMVGQVAGLFSTFMRFTGAGDKLKTFFSTFGYAGKHVGATTSAFRGLLGLVGRLAKFAGPVGLIVWAGTLIAKSDELKAKLSDVWDAFKSVFSALGGAFSEISNALQPVISGLSPVFDILDKIAGLAIGIVLDQIAQAFRTLASVISGVGTFIAGFITVLTGLFTLDFSKMWDGLKQMASGFMTVIQAVADQLMSMLQPARLLEMGRAALSALWNGITTVIPIILTGIGTLATNILNFFINLPGQLLELGKQAFSSLTGAAVDSGPGILSAVGDIIMGIIEFFVTLPLELLALAANAFAAVIEGITTHGPGILSAAGGIVAGILEFFITLPLRLLTLAMNAFAAVLEGIATHGPGIIKAAGEIVDNVIDWFDKLPGRLLALATAAFLYVVQAIRDHAPGILSKAGEIINGVIDWFEELPGRLLALATEAFLKVVNAITNSDSKVRNAARRVKDSIINAIKNLPSELRRIGSDMISQLASGILGKLQSVRDAASRIVGAVKKFFPGSPVKEGPLKAWNYGGGASGGGRNLIDAIAKGLQDISPITKAMNDVSSVVSDAMTPASGPRRASSSSGGTDFRPGTIDRREIPGITLVVNNPVSEPTEVTLNRQMQRLAALGVV